MGEVTKAMQMVERWETEWLASVGDHWGDAIEWGTARQIALRIDEAMRNASPVGPEVERVRQAMARTESEGFSPEVEQILMDDLPKVLAAISTGVVSAD